MKENAQSFVSAQSKLSINLVDLAINEADFFYQVKNTFLFLKNVFYVPSGLPDGVVLNQESRFG
jgi:hypothetical protein